MKTLETFWNEFVEGFPPDMPDAVKTDMKKIFYIGLMYAMKAFDGIPDDPAAAFAYITGMRTELEYYFIAEDQKLRRKKENASKN